MYLIYEIYKVTDYFQKSKVICPHSSACEGVDLLSLSNEGNQSGIGGLRGSSSPPELSTEDKRMLDAYQHSVLDEYADVDLVHSLCLKLHKAQPSGKLFTS